MLAIVLMLPYEVHVLSLCVCVCVDRALELAQKLRSHVDTVLAYRARYLATLGREETNKKFVSASEGVSASSAFANVVHI